MANRTCAGMLYETEDGRKFWRCLQDGAITRVNGIELICPTCARVTSGRKAAERCPTKKYEVEYLFTGGDFGWVQLSSVQKGS